MFLLLFTYVFGGAIAHGSVQPYLQYVLPGILVQTVAVRDAGYRADAEPGHLRRDLRPVPQPADRALGAAGGRDHGRRHPVRDLGGRHARLRHDPGLPRARPAAGRSRGLPAGPGLRAGDVLDLRADRDAGQDSAGGADVRLPRDVPDRVRQRPAGADSDDARLAAGIRQGEPDDAAGRRLPRADDRRAGRGLRPASRCSGRWASSWSSRRWPCASTVARHDRRHELRRSSSRPTPPRGGSGSP